MAGPFPDITISSVPPTGRCCIWRVEKHADGQRTVDFQERYPCNNGTTTHPNNMVLQLRLKHGDDHCDELAEVINDGSRLDARGSYLLRLTDNLGHFSGRFTIRNAAGVIIFRGWIETFDRVGTHHVFGVEACNEENHLEGWLVARGAGPAARFTLRGFLVAKAPPPADNQKTPVEGTITGVLVECG